MKYLITGGAGFIGSHLVEKLILRGDSVVVLDDFSTGNIDNLITVKSQCTLVEGNILDLDLVSRHIKAVDSVIHLAAAVGVSQSKSDLTSKDVPVVLVFISTQEYQPPLSKLTRGLP